jgi:hypothetical protein
MPDTAVGGLAAVSPKARRLRQPYSENKRSSYCRSVFSRPYPTTGIKTEGIFFDSVGDAVS